MNERMGGDSIPFRHGPNPDAGTPIHSTPSEAWDRQAPIFGPLEQYPFTPNRSLTPPEGGLTENPARLYGFSAAGNSPTPRSATCMVGR